MLQSIIFCVKIQFWVRQLKLPTASNFWLRYNCCLKNVVKKSVVLVMAACHSGLATEKLTWTVNVWGQCFQLLAVCLELGYLSMFSGGHHDFVEKLTNGPGFPMMPRMTRGLPVSPSKVTGGGDSSYVNIVTLTCLTSCSLSNDIILLNIEFHVLDASHVQHMSVWKAKFVISDLS